MNENKKITENKLDVPYIVYEGDMARSERHIKRQECRAKQGYLKAQAD